MRLSSDYRRRLNSVSLGGVALHNKNKAANYIAALLAYHEGFEPPAFWSVARRSIQLG